MQLEGTLFAVCVVQIKPQLEKVLNLPPRSLTKEIALTQQLMNLFIEFQASCRPSASAPTPPPLWSLAGLSELRPLSLPSLRPLALAVLT